MHEYNYTKGDELEVRMFIDSRNNSRPRQLTPPEWMELSDTYIKKTIEHIGKMDSIHQYVDILVPDEGRHQREFDPSTGKQIHSGIWTTKKHVSSHQINNESGGVRISHTQEVNSPGSSRIVSNISGGRLKVRGSKVFKELPDWRFDVTIILAIKTTAGIKDIRKAFIYPLKPEEWSEKAPFQQASWIEFEYEYIGADGKVSINNSTLHTMYNLLLGWVPGTEHNAWLTWFAETIGTPSADKFTTPGSMRLIHKYQFLVPKAKEVGPQKWRDMFNDTESHLAIRQKVDGERQFVCINEYKATTIRGGYIDYNPSGLIIPDMPSDGVYIWDTEYMDGVWYILHPLVHNSQQITHLSCGSRIDTLDEIKFNGSSFTICPRVECSKDDFGTMIQSIWSTHKLRLDGLLITLDTRVGYWAEQVIKWKPEPTLDFLVIRCPSQIEGKLPYVRAREDDILYILLVGCQHQHYYVPNIIRAHLPVSTVYGYRPIPFSPSDKPYAHIYSSSIPDLHGFVCEFYYRNNEWVFKKKRDDRLSIVNGGTDIGNNFNTAIATWARIINPFRLEDLYTSRLMPEVAFPSGMPDSKEAKTVILYRPPVGLIPPKTYRHVISIGPNPVRGLRNFDEPGIGLPAEFIGGAELVISFQIPATNSARKWTGLMKDFVAAGGTLIHIPSGDGMDPGTDFKVVDVSPAEGAEKAPYGARWYRYIAGMRAMTPAQIHKENVHTRGNPASTYLKYRRKKNTDFTPVDVKGYELSAKYIPGRGETLCNIEFLMDIDSSAIIGPVVIICNMPADDIKFLQELFPAYRMTQYSAEGKYDTPRALIGKYDENVIKRVSAAETFMTGFHPGCPGAPISVSGTFPIPKCIIVYIPYDAGDSVSTGMLISGKISGYYIGRVDMWNREMLSFQYAYRQSCFRYEIPRNLADTFDHCYDCRTEIYILSRYIKKHTSRTLIQLVDML